MIMFKLPSFQYIIYLEYFPPGLCGYKIVNTFSEIVVRLCNVPEDFLKIDYKFTITITTSSELCSWKLVTKLLSHEQYLPYRQKIIHIFVL